VPLVYYLILSILQGGLASATPLGQGSGALPADSVLLADFGGVGGARVGTTIQELALLLGDTVQIEDWNPPDCDYAHFSALPEVSVMVWGDSIMRFDMYTPAVRTTEGIGVGTTERDVLEAYPQGRLAPHPYDGPEGHYVIVDAPEDGQLGMIFETDGSVVTSYRVGFRRAVALIEGCS